MNRENKIRITEIYNNNNNDKVKSDPTRFGVEKAREAHAFHQTIEGYEATPLCSLQHLAKEIGLGGIFVKDESRRFGLNAFKGLGGSFAIHYAAGDKKSLTFVTATDGNHGRGVAWAAARLGHRAFVYLPKGSAPERLANIQKLGAYAEITEMSYDDTVRYAAKMAEENGWILIQDTSWDGYEEIPEKIMQGYTTIGYEIAEQLCDQHPTHIFLQAGVGAMAGALTAFFADYYRKEKPVIVIVEPEGADCIFRTAAADDGRLHFCGADMETIMAGLCCGEPCPLGWEILKDHAEYVIACADEIAAIGMRILGNPLPSDPIIISGESGAVSVGAAAELMRKPAYEEIRRRIGLDESSVLLCISTEGDTDRQNYREIVWYGTDQKRYPVSDT